MLINKSILQGALNICKVDKSPVFIDKDGTVISLNKMVLYVAEPVVQEIAFGSKEPLEEQVIISATTAEQIIKAIPKDTLFKGRLEHADILVKGLDIDVNVRDGQREHSISLRRISRSFIDYKQVLRETYESRGERLPPSSL